MGEAKKRADFLERADSLDDQLNNILGYDANAAVYGDQGRQRVDVEFYIKSVPIERAYDVGKAIAAVLAEQGGGGDE